MRLLLLLPNFVLLSISGYNLINEFTWKNEPNYLIFKLLHILVMVLCTAFVVMILKSVFTIKYVEVAEPAGQETSEAFEAVHIQHS